MTIESINGEPARQSPFAPALRAGGALGEVRGLRLEPPFRQRSP